MKDSYALCGAWSLCVLLAGCGTESSSNAQPDAAAGQAGAIEQTDSSPEMDAVVIDDSVVALLKQMTSKVAGLQEFAVTLETGFDVLQPNDQKLEFGSRRTATIRRPDHARFTYQQRSGVAGELVFDGSAIWAYERDQNVYATIEQPGDIDASLDLVTIELGIPVPVSDFFAKDPSIALAADVLEAQDLGTSTIDNQPARHIALRKPGVDYQIWISDATLLPVRVVITYHDEPGQPQFWAQFLNWETAPTNSDAVFAFSPPEGAESIRFATFDTSESAEDEAP
jgi:hypothetical protein